MMFHPFGATAFPKHYYNLGILDEHVTPFQPGTHWQVNAFIRSVHVPPCKQGLEAHSLVSGEGKGQDTLNMSVN